MDMKKIKELMAAMIEYDMHHLSVKDKTTEITLERPPLQVVSQPVAVAPVSNEPAPADVEETFITSPMVGSFFMAPAPDAASFVKVGDRISKDTVVCVVEAMKVMNEVKAGLEGVIEEVLMESGHPVEFGTKLFRVRKHA